jgi:2-phospho-L-lactate transferase CofD
MLNFTSADEGDQPSLHGMPLLDPGPSGPCIPPDQPALLVFSGGTAFNSVAGHVRALSTLVTHVLPVTDDGGSTAEIVRVLGGPAVGDIRSRCLRLADDSDGEAQAVRQLLAHRLASHSAAQAKQEWYDIVEGDHPLWEVRSCFGDWFVCCLCVWVW